MSVATRQAITPAPFGFCVLPSAKAVPNARRRVIRTVRGWGLPLAEDALRGVEPDPAGKRIWFEVGTTAAVSGDERLTALVRAAAPKARDVVPTSA
ncbi:hypothetical protein ACFWXO_02365 [Kitasatospora sp. NPDC059088]|uniref:hypothetical protein n=1 Tax=Kitasatospora sp. NPDC059088 TaxID=3346722 RepID=UPI0036CDF79E